MKHTSANLNRIRSCRHGFDSGAVRSLRGPPCPSTRIVAVTVTVGITMVPRQAGGGDHVTGGVVPVGVDSKSSAPTPSVRARRDSESPSALRYGGGSGSVTRIVASTVSKAPLALELHQHSGRCVYITNMQNMNLARIAASAAR
jgi:hypothetical protein